MQGWDYFRQFMLGLANLYGLTDSLTPGSIVYRHNDPKCPGEMRVRLAKEGIVIIQYFFREAPSAKCIVTVPVDQYKKGMEHSINSQQVIMRLMNMLLNRGVARQEAIQEEEGPPKPRIALPGD